MYGVVRSCIKDCNSSSGFFNLSIGLRQGNKESPTLIALFLDEIELSLRNRTECGIEMINLCLISLLCVDDMVIIGHST